MRLRRLVSLVLFLSFLVLVLTSIVLYVTPQGRVAFWADWRMLGLDKEQWGNLHINLGLLFLVAGIWHTAYNWRPILTYMGRTVSKAGKKPGREFWVATFVSLFFVVGTLFELPVLFFPIHLNVKIKDQAAIDFGMPPYGHAELSSLQEFTLRTKLDLERSLDRLREEGLVVTGKKQTLLAIAKVNRTSPQKIFQLLRPESEAVGLPEFPPPGFGRLTISEISEVYKIPLPRLLRRLKEVGIESDGQQKFMELAQAHNRQPSELYKLLLK